MSELERYKKALELACEEIEKSMIPACEMWGYSCPYLAHDDGRQVILCKRPEAEWPNCMPEYFLAQAEKEK